MPNLKPKKDLGQNFLKDESVIDKAIIALEISPEDQIIEIGGGHGAITKKLLKYSTQFKNLDIFEIDDELCKILQDLAQEHINVAIKCGDFLKHDLNQYSRNTKVIGAIPYYITSPIIHNLLKMQEPPEKIVLIIQKEVADKILAKPKQSYWSHTIFGYDVRKIIDIDKKAFFPSPSVDSTVILLTRNEDDQKILEEISHKKWAGFLHKCFTNPRKMLNKKFNKIEFEKAKIDPSKRAHELTRTDLLNLFTASSSIN